MPRLLRRVWAATALGTGLTLVAMAAPVAPAGAELTPGEATELVFIHGYSPEVIAADCGKDFGFMSDGWQGVALSKYLNGKYWGYHYPAYYTAVDANGDGTPEEQADVNCWSHRFGRGSAPAVMRAEGPATATRNTPIRDLALDFARWFRHEFVTSRPGSYPPRVDVVGHSMGGLIVRAALKYYWPFFLDPLTGASMLDDVVTAGTPHDGGKYPCALGEAGCNRQRNDMNQGSSFLAPLNAAPQTAAWEANPKLLADLTTVSSGYQASVFDNATCAPEPTYGLPGQNPELSTGTGHNDHDFATDLVSGVSPDEDHEWRLCNVRHDHYFWPQPDHPAETYSAWLIDLVLDDPAQNL